VTSSRRLGLANVVVRTASQESSRRALDQSDVDVPAPGRQLAAHITEERDVDGGCELVRDWSWVYLEDECAVSPVRCNPSISESDEV
jgi:hypothetical protein